ncbi:hypothetical protein DSL72_008009 [Monilinia vaccinii-corymbosi]|uniref:Uncharacterized protein n=1 Tax=Monilinia vaccinii-corymbosi TaxID=61207 RepID=A0A8A3PJH8_9HELO|nr:hypothetical protein DSL72_008009 [Monilinia vaccinii-corymbosi]
MSTPSGSTDVQKPQRWELFLYELLKLHYQKGRFTDEEIMEEDVLKVLKKAVPDILSKTREGILLGIDIGRELWFADRRRRSGSELLSPAEEPEESSRTRGSSEETVGGDIQHAFIQDKDQVKILGVIRSK